MRIHGPRRRREKWGDQAGFTLIEVMIAFVIMGIGLLTIGLAQLSALRMTTRSRQVSQAMYLAQEQLDLFQAARPTAGGTFNDPGNPIDVDPNDREAGTFNRSWNIQLNNPAVGLATVQVTVVINNPEGGPGNYATQNQVILQGIVPTGP